MSGGVAAVLTGGAQALKDIRRRASEIARDAPAVIDQGWKLRRDPLFRLDMVFGGLEARPTEASLHHRLDTAGRILVAYKRAVAEQERRSDLYRPSNEWLPIFRRPLKPLIAALNDGDRAGLVDLLDNFFRSSVSLGLCGLATDMRAVYFERRPTTFRQLQYLVDALYRWRLLQRLLPDVNASDLHIPDTGNPYGLMIDGSFVRTGADYQYYYARRSCELVAEIGPPAVVAELGGGIGGYGYFLAQLLPPGSTYIDFDLPEILAVAQYHLMTSLPNEDFLLYGEVEHISPAAIAASRLAMLPSFTIEDLPAQSVALFFNAYSLAEMDPGSIANYVHHMSRVTHHAVYHVNHVERARLGADQFDFGDRFELAERRQAMWNLGRNLRADEFEFLLVASQGRPGTPTAGPGGGVTIPGG